MSELDYQNNFELIFKKIVIPLIPQMEAEIDNEFKDSTGFHIKDLNDTCTLCKSFYERKKVELKKIFYGDKFSLSDEKNLLFDIHKVASISCYSLIKHKIFIFDENSAINFIKERKIEDSTWIINNALVNYKLAFHMSVSMIYYKLLYDASKQCNTMLADAIKSQKNLSLYKTRTGHESFANSIILDLAKRDIHKRSFDYFLYSAILFQLEEYNKEFFKKN